ncbi:MAG: helix-turn-helix domain-containing protein [Rickettsiales bacterium]|nr:helix-turn-helix domain-containing protein [Rickettsiales bacterium]
MIQNETDISLAEILKAKRLELGMEIADAASYLKIRTQDIEAIENDDRASITKHLYILGAIRSYAKLLKIDQKILEEKIKFFTVESNVKNKKHKLINIGENLDLKPTRDQFFNFLLISILLFLVLLSLYNFFETNNNMITMDNLLEEIKKMDTYSQ